MSTKLFYLLLFCLGGGVQQLLLLFFWGGRVCVCAPRIPLFRVNTWPIPLPLPVWPAHSAPWPIPPRGPDAQTLGPDGELVWREIHGRAPRNETIFTQYIGNEQGWERT